MKLFAYGIMFGAIIDSAAPPANAPQLLP